MSRYPDDPRVGVDQQFTETPAERNERRRETVRERQVETLHTLIADLSTFLLEARALTISETERVLRLRCRVANALPPDKCPGWLAGYRDSPIIQSAP